MNTHRGSRQNAFILLILLGSTTTALSHGVILNELSEGKGVEVQYDDQTPLAYCDVDIFSPARNDQPFQKGITDPHGRFMFFPDCPGTWTIKVNDGLGHGIVHEMLVVEHAEKGTLTPGPRFSRRQNIMIGLAVIFGLTGIATFAATLREKRGS